MSKKQNDLMTFPIHVPREIERLFEEMIHRPWGFCREIRGWNPSIDLYENSTCFVLEADLPGVKPEDVAVEIDNGDLVLRGSRSLVQTRQEGRYRTMERSSGHFLRRFTLPESVDASQIKAEFREGVLRVTIPKITQREGSER